MLTHEVSDLLLALGAIIEDVKIDADGVMMELVRLDLWARVNDYDRWYELSHRIIFEILPNLQTDSDWIDTQSLVSSASMIDFEAFVALSNAIAINITSSPSGFKFPPHFPMSVLDQDVIGRFIKFWSISIEDARLAANVDICDKRLWSFTAFYDKPIIDFGSGNGITIRPWFVANKPTPTGFFSTVESIIRTNAKNEAERNREFLKWSRLFGKATEILARLIIDEYIPTMNRIDELDMELKWGKGKQCDTILMDNDWIPIDFVYRRMNRMTTTTGDITDLAKDLRVGVIEKLEQIDETLERAMIKEGEPAGYIYPLVVIGAPFSVNGLLLNEVDRSFDLTNPNVIGKNSKCKSPMIIDLEEYWLMLETAGHNKISPAKLLNDWISSRLKVSNFRNWLIAKGPAQAPFKGKRRYSVHALETIFGKGAYKQWLAAAVSKPKGTI